MALSSIEPSHLAISVAFAATVVSLVLGIYQYILYPLFWSPLAKIPAARWHSRIVPLYSWYIKYTNVENREVHKLHTKLGPVFVLGPNELSVNSADGLKTIYNGDFAKTEWYFDRFSNFGVDNIFTTRDPKQHHQRKRLLTQAYSKTTILAASAIPATTSNVVFNNLFPILQQSADSRQPVNLHPLDYAYSVDSFTTYQLGADLGTNFVGDSKAREWLLHHFFAPRPYTVFWEVELPRFTRWLMKLGVRLVPAWCEKSRVALEEFFLERYDKAAKITDHVAQGSEEKKSFGLNWPTIFAIAKEKYGAFGERSFMTDEKTPSPSPACTAVHEENGKYQYYHRLQIASDMYDETVAAVETSGIALTFLHYELGRRPDIQEALREELKGLFGKEIKGEQELREAIEMVSLRELDNLPLLDAVITETLRTYPPVGGPQGRYTPNVPGGTTLNGYEGIPGGVRVQSYAWSLHRNSEVYPKPEEWHPRRWTEASNEELVEMRKWFWAFGSGGRMCLGKNFAMVSMKLVVAAMYLRYRTEFVGADKDGKVKVLEHADGFSAGPTSNALWLQFHELMK
ncbi:cytochrome P450 [Naviculisporaceae sp. PSN 640]